MPVGTGPNRFIVRHAIRRRFYPGHVLVFAVMVMLVVACGGAEPTGKRAQESIPRADQTGAPLDAIASATEFPSLPLPTATPPPQTCDPVQRARLARFENVSLPASNPLSDSFRSIILPAAWLIVDGTAVIGTSAVFQCTPLESESFPCPDDPALNCSNSTLHVDWVQDIGAPKDHSRVSAVGPLAGKRFEILVDTSDIEFFASHLCCGMTKSPPDSVQKRRNYHPGLPPENRPTCIDFHHCRS